MLGLGCTTAALAVILPVVFAQLPPTPSSWPHDYPGKPSGDFGPEWQNYFEVKDPLANVTFPLPRSFAGNIGVNRPGHPNNTLFFWGFEKENGSLTAAAGERDDVPWGIWLNGGPGSSSMMGFVYENGAIRIQPDGSPSPNNYSWDRLADYIWIDQPVGTGWATADSDGYAHDEDEVGRDFMGFLENLVKVFPSLKTRPLYLTGESYAGTYIPYIMKTYFGLVDPPVNIVKFAIGDGTLGAEIVYDQLPTVTTLETYPQLIGYDTEVFEYFREQEHLCGLDLNFTYPQDGHFPTLHYVNPTPGDPSYLAKHKAYRKALRKELLVSNSPTAREARNIRTQASQDYVKDQVSRRDAEHAALVKSERTFRPNGMIDPWYGCILQSEIVEYAINFTYPWNVHANISTWAGFDVYQMSDALDPESPINGGPFFNDPKTRAALHAPTSKNWAGSIPYPFLGDPVNGQDPSVEPMAFMDDLAANASAKNIAIVLYSGNEDLLVAHRGTEVVIQNTTFGGIQGFTRKPSTPWYTDEGKRAGIVHQERNWTYVLLENVGHLIAYNSPPLAYTLLREFILGNNQTGLVTTVDGAPHVVGGEDPALAVDAIRATNGIYVGSITTESTYAYPSATIAAWDSYIATATATATVLAGPASTVGALGTPNAAVSSKSVGSVFTIAGTASFLVSLLALA